MKLKEYLEWKRKGEKQDDRPRERKTTKKGSSNTRRRTAKRATNRES